MHYTKHNKIIHNIFKDVVAFTNEYFIYILRTLLWFETLELQILKFCDYYNIGDWWIMFDEYWGILKKSVCLALLLEIWKLILCSKFRQLSLLSSNLDTKYLWSVSIFFQSIECQKPLILFHCGNLKGGWGLKYWNCAIGHYNNLWIFSKLEKLLL